jgi:hypothetical protein
MKDVKALIVQMPYENDLTNVIQVARAEGMKLFHNSNKIRVVDVLKWYPHGWIVVVQNGDGCISEKKKMNE